MSLSGIDGAGKPEWKNQTEYWTENNNAKSS